MKKTQKILMTTFVGLLVLALLLAVLHETDVLIGGSLADDHQTEFLAATVMELTTLAGVFLALRLFKFKSIHHELVTLQAPALLKWGLLRLALLEGQMFCNTYLYYMYLSPTFGYLAIIQLLCLPFVWPSMSRCVAETTEEETA
ncbi:MAG: hypothetical protein IJ067_03185 [Prevotella sp.]|nr:hypothetical protein [Prevotella sp.]